MRIEQLTFTRFIAAISIVIYHHGREVNLFFNNYTSFIFEQANLGVSYFFILSGFVMIIAYGNRNKINFFDYLRNRFARIYPVYLLGILLTLGANLFQNINIVDLILNITMLQSWFPEKALTLNIPGWSLSVELFFYISFPILLNYFYSKKNLINITIWLVLFFVFSQIIYHLMINGVIKLTYYSIKDVFFHPLLHLNEFLIGNLAGLFYVKKLKNIQGNYIIPIIFLILLLLILLKFPIGLNYNNGLLSVVFIPMIILISLSYDKLTKLISKKTFVFLGEISYGIYILHGPLRDISTDYRMNKYFGLNKDIYSTELFFLRLFILIVISSLSYLYFEKPIRNKIKNYAQQRTELKN